MTKKSTDKNYIEKAKNSRVIKIAGFTIVVIIAFVAGVFSSDFLKKSLKIQAVNAYPGATVVDSVPNSIPQVAVSPGVPANQPTALVPTQVVLSPEHQQHLTALALKVSEAAKTGNYSYLYGEIDNKEEIQKIDIAEAKFLFDSGKAVFVDARGPAEYEQGHVKGSVNVPTSATPEEIVKLKDKIAGKVLVTYCHGTGCHLADKSAVKLFEAGYRKIAIFWGGWPKWNEHKYPVELKK